VTGAGLLRADALSLPLGDATVDLIVTSPPYFALRSYSDGGEHYEGQIGSEATPTAFLEALWAVTAECWRVLKPGGSLWVNLGDKYAGTGGHNNGGIAKPHTGSITFAGQDRNAASRPAKRRTAPDRYNQASDGIRAKSLMGLPWRYAIGCIDGQADPDGKGWILRAEVVWSKPNGLPESVTDRVRRSHEHWFHFTKEGRYYSAVDRIREEHVGGLVGMTWAERKAAGEPMRHGDAAGGASEASPGSKAANPLGKLPGSVWTIPTQPLIVPDWLNVDHFAAFPTEWPRRIIEGWSPSGVCTACGEGRRPVAERDTSSSATAVASDGGTPDNNWGGGREFALKPTYSITGECCACPDATAPTTPAVVLDPFGGTGTTAMVARALGRYGVSVDLSADYLRLARWRIWQSGGAAKVRARSDREAQGVLL